MHQVTWWAVVAIAAGNLSVTNAALNLTDRGCNSNDTLVHPSDVSYRTHNATGSVRTPGFFNSSEQWTWSTAVQVLPGDSFIYQPVWVDTAGTDLTTPGRDLDLCYVVLEGHSQAAQKRGQGDKGDCMKFLGAECVADWRSMLMSQASSFRSSSSFRSNNTRDSPCGRLSIPTSCKENQGSFRSFGKIPYSRSSSSTRNCSLGGGDPDYDAVAVLANTLPESEGAPGATKFNTYDEMITRIVPFFVMGYPAANATGFPWPESRIMCLSTPDVVEGSRKPAGVPSVATTASLASYSMVSSLVAAMVWILL